MPERRPPPDDRSEGGWSDPGVPGDQPRPSTPVGGAPRYEVGALLGRGGMGVVHAARDTALGRDVALKELQPELADHATAASRLAREAAITSRLDHPGIVAVHDVGHLPDGRPFYTMRLVRGQTLTWAVTNATTPAARRQLVRHVLAAAEAVAAAHDAGIVHRDLKPSNILIGPHGETQVVDWGLATPTPAATTWWADLPGLATLGPVGTDAYRAPEQARGEPPDPRHDVWSLGATLVAVFGGIEALPPELAAVAARAMAVDPDGRYPDAAAFADELLRWFEGRRVAAHAYTPGELLRRTLRAYRLPLAVGAMGLFVVAIAVGAGWWQTSRSLHRALAAEAEAAEALADLQLERAVEATKVGARERAERLALAVLEKREDSLARGVFAAFGRAERPVRRSTGAGPACTWSTLSTDGRALFCGHAGDVQRWEGGQILWTAPVAATEGRLYGAELVTWDGVGTTRVLDGATGAPRGEWVVGTWQWMPEVAPRKAWADGRAFPSADTPPCPCTGNLRVVEPASEGRLAAACGDGRLWFGTVANPTAHTVVTDFVGDHVVTALAWLPGGRVAVGSLRGRLAVFDVASGARVAAGTTPLGSIGRITASPDGNVLALGGTLGGIGLWRVDTATTIGEVPAARPRAFTLTDAGLQVHAGDLSTWQVPTGAPAMVRASGGLADVSASPRGDRIALAAGDGTVSSIRLADGRADHLTLGDRVVKAVVFGADGESLLASGLGAPFLARLAPPGAPLPGARRLRRLAALPDGSVVGADLHTGLYRLADLMQAPTILAADTAFTDVERDGDTLVVLDGHGGVSRLDGTALHPLVTVPQARAVALRGDRLAVAVADGVEVQDGPVVRRLEAPGASLIDVALSLDGRRVAAVGLDPTVRVWDADSGALIGQLPGHDERVVAVEFLPDGDLVTASWDKSARIWSLGALTTPVATLREDVAAAWGGSPPLTQRPC